MPSAGSLRSRIGFYRRVVIDDGAGNEQGDYAETPEFTCAAELRPRFGGEQVMAARLGGKNIVTITVRYFAATAAVTTDWMAKDERSGVGYNLRSIVDPDRRRAWLEMLAEEGVAP